MNKNNFTLKPYYTYLGLCVAYFLVIGSIVLFYDKGKPELYFNGYWNPLLDFFFDYYTNIGDGWFYTVFNISLLFVGFYETLIALISILITTVIVQYFKLSLFHETLRPRGFFPNETVVHYVEGVQVHLTNSFPSGHTSTGMCMGMILAFLVVKYCNHSQRNAWLIVVFTTSLLVALSRVYLMQHFFVDTIAGTVLGTLIPLTVIIIFEKYTFLKNHKFWSLSLLRLNR